jgi:predicted nucleotidyltransferase
MLGEGLIAVYLYGSLATGDFQYRVSDIDVLVALNEELTEKQFKSLNDIHHQLLDNFPSWKDRIEIAYIASDTLKNIKSGMRKVSIISPGEPFHTKPIGNDWVINAYLIRQTGVTLYGPEPKGTITEIGKPEFLEAVKQQIIEWKDWIQNTKNSVAYQYYAVLTLCRCLYLLKKGEQASKLQAAEWAMQQLPKWKELICQAASAYRNNFEHLDADPDASYEYVVKFVNEV